MAKIICVGHQKTGTTSLANALTALGYAVGNPHTPINKKMDWKAPDHRGQLKKITLDVLAVNEAIEDTPCAHFHKELDFAFPGSKFILTIRNQDSWLNSFSKFFGNEFNEIRKFMYGVDQLSGNETAVLDVYNGKNNEIIEYFKDRPDDLLVLDLEAGDGWGKLVAFLGDGFLKPFPHANKSGTGWRSSTNRRLRRRILKGFYMITIVVLLIIWAYQ